MSSPNSLSAVDKLKRVTESINAELEHFPPNRRLIMELLYHGETLLELLAELVPDGRDIRVGAAISRYAGARAAARARLGGQAL